MEESTGTTKDDVKVPEGEAATKIAKMFTEEGKDVSKYLSTLDDVVE
jgi:hypothetical protein